MKLRKLTTVVSGIIGVFLLSSALQAAEIRVMNWNGYGTDEAWAIAHFEKATGHKVTHDYFNSEQELLTKLRTNPDAYDVVMINSAFTKQAKSEDLISEIDVSKISNFTNLAPNMAKNADLVPDGKVYGVAWTWGVTSFGVNSDTFKEKPTSIQIFWDKKYKGKVGWRDDPLESVQFAALATGQNINDIKDMKLIKTKLESLLPQIKAFWSSENDWNQYMAAGDFVIAPFWSGSAGRSISKGLPISFVIPKEGAIGWLDGLSIAKGSKNRDAAHAFIDYMISAEFYVKWAGKGAPAPANSKAAAALPDTDFNKITLGDPAVVKRVQFMQPVSDEKRKIYLEMWQELKASQ